MKICKRCLLEKNESEYYKYTDGYLRGACKKCLAEEQTKRRSGIQVELIPYVPWNKDKNISQEQKDQISKTLKGRKVTKEQREKQLESMKVFRISEGRKGYKGRQWTLSVKERDNWKCQHCGIQDREKLQSHHIVPWEDNKELRFDINNGLTLCRVCHKKEDRRIKPMKAWNKGRKLSKTHIENLKKSHLGRVAWNKGKKMSDEYCRIMSNSRIGKPSGRKGIPSGNKGRGWRIDELTGKRTWYDK